MKNVTSYRVNSALAASKKSITSVFWGTALMLGALSAYSDVPFPAVPVMPVAPVVPEFPMVETPPLVGSINRATFDRDVVPLPEYYDDPSEYESDAWDYAKSRRMNYEEFYAAQDSLRAYISVGSGANGLPIFFYMGAVGLNVKEVVPITAPEEPRHLRIFPENFPLPIDAAYRDESDFNDGVCAFYIGDNWCSPTKKYQSLNSYYAEVEAVGYPTDYEDFKYELEREVNDYDLYHQQVAIYEKNALEEYYRAVVSSRFNRDASGSWQLVNAYCGGPWTTDRQYVGGLGEDTFPDCGHKINGSEEADYAYLYSPYSPQDDSSYLIDPDDTYYQVYENYNSEYLGSSPDGYAFKEWKEFVPVMQHYQVQMEALATLLLEDISVLPAIPAIPQSYPVPPYPAYLVDDPDDGFKFRSDQGGPVDLEDILYSRDPHYIVYYRKWLRYQGHLDAFGKAMQDYYAGWGAYRDAIGQFMAEEEEARRLKETGAIDLHTIGCEISHGKCFVYTELTYGPVQCSDNILQWTHLAPNGDETLSLLLAGFVSGTKVNFGITDQCLDGYPTFDYFNSLKYYVEENEYTPDQQIEKDVFLGQMISAAGEIYKQKYSGSQNFSGRSVDSIGCLAASNDCFFYTDSPVGPAACSSTAVAWDSTSAGSDQVMSLLMAAQSTGKKININTASACYDQDTPTFNYIEMLNQ